MDLDRKRLMGNGYFKSRDMIPSKWGEYKNKRNIVTFELCGGVILWIRIRRN